MKLIIVILLFGFGSFAQKKEGQMLVDSLLSELKITKTEKNKADILNELAINYRTIDLNLCEDYAKQALTLAKKIKYPDAEALGYRNLGVALTNKGNYDDAMINYKNGIKATKNKKIIGQILGSIGRIYSLQGNYVNALDYNLQALSYFEEINDKKLQSVVLSNISNMYLNMGNTEKFNEFGKKSKDILTQKTVSKINCPIDSSKKPTNKYKQEFEKNSSSGKKFENGEVLFKQAKILLVEKKLDQALTNINLAFAIFEKNNEHYFKANSLLLESQILFEKYKTEKNVAAKNNLIAESLTAVNQAIVINKTNKQIANNYYCFMQKTLVFEFMGNYKAALEAQKYTIIYKDSLINKKNKETLKNLEDKREIELRDKQIKINQLEIKAQAKQKWFYILGLGFFATLGGLLFYQSRKRKQVNHKLAILNSELDIANKNKARFFGILNHDLRGPVSNLIHFLHLQKNNPELLTEESKNRLQNQTINGAENLLTSMEDILFWSKSQMENFKPKPKKININQLFDDTKKVFSGYLKIEFEYQNPNNIEVFTDENYLKTIIRNLTSNAINAFTSTENPKIIWKAWQNNDKTYLSIQDNGPGANEEQFKALFEDTEISSNKSGLGLYLIKDMAKAIDCEITVDSKIGVGTTFILKL